MVSISAEEFMQQKKLALSLTDLNLFAKQKFNVSTHHASTYTHIYIIFGRTNEPVWPSGKALLGWQVEGPRFDTASALLSLQKACGLWTLSCDLSITSY